MMCLGGAHTLGSIGVHLFSQHFQRPIIMAAGGWGLCNAIWETLTLTFLASTYPDDWQAPFCTYYQLQWFGMAISFCISPYLCTEIKILALAIFLAVSIIPYTILNSDFTTEAKFKTERTCCEYFKLLRHLPNKTLRVPKTLSDQLSGGQLAKDQVRRI
ncbi:uncharacterized protein CEXT_740291 [Caerostris extrusa]|uniref:Uncharacterized protein n=1 Tax=Caerostris extrusa TaxID=172846 RepID=A0AAV4SP97_CAEEX|nr:uncharacterized protein CEXT_740291 [Caerostris extrusa]